MRGLAAVQSSNLNVKTGGVLVYQGEEAKTLILLHQGKASFQFRFNEGNEKAYIPVCLMNAPAVLGSASLVLNKLYPYSIISASPVVLTSLPGTQESLIKFFVARPNMAPLLLRSLLKEVIDTFNKVNTVSSVTINLSRYIFSLGLAYLKIESNAVHLAEQNKEDHILQEALKAHQSFAKRGGSIPNEITMGFLKEDYIGPNVDDAYPNIDLNKDKLNYYRKFILLRPQILGAIAASEPQFIFMTAQKVSQILSTLLGNISDLSQQMDDKINSLFDPKQGWAKKLASMLTGRRDPANLSNWENICHFFVNVVGFVEKQYQSISENDFSALVDQESLKEIKLFLSRRSASVQAEEKNKTTSIEVDPKALEATKDMAQKVFDYAGLTSKFAEYSSLINKLNTFKNPLGTDSDVRKLRRGINNIFWVVYEEAALKHIQKKNALPRYMEIFFNFSVLEPGLLEPEQLSLIYNAKENESFKRYSIYTPLEWLKNIYERKAPTSINELGLTFFEIIRQNNREKQWKRESDLPPDADNPEKRLRFEIKNMLITTTKLTSGSVITYLAPLSKYQIVQPLKRSFVGKRKLEETLDKLLDIDFSCFHREILYEKPEMGILREFIQTQVIPNFIFTPAAGNIFQFWQEREGKNKLSPGRLCCPSIAVDDLYKILLNVVGCYRWELTKTIMGPDWNNIAASSVTADYTDYVQFFKKNRNLSPEMKGKIAQEFKRFRDDRSRFMHDYSIWVMHESEGTQRLNKVARKIMAKHIPFRKPYRDKLLKLPSYTDLVNKNINIRRRKARDMEPRIKKYRQNNNNELPTELLETWKFYNMEY